MCQHNRIRQFKRVLQTFLFQIFKVNLADHKLDRKKGRNDKVNSILGGNTFITQQLHMTNSFCFYCGYLRSLHTS